ncbi:MAG: tetratricopeptide repeat protein [Bacteroidetes bacterium]|nr:tetratricopeptide repeat protein [Bacteroidota bacterium]
MERELFDSAFFYADMADRKSRDQASDLHLEARIAYALGKSYAALNEPEPARQYYQTAISKARLVADTLLVASAYNDLGRILKSGASYSEALHSFNLARQYYFAAGDSSGIALVSLNVGNILKNVGHNELAKAEYHKALNYFIRSGDVANQAGCYNNLGNIFKNDQQYDSAFYYMYLTLAIRKQGESRSGLAIIYHNLANLHLRVHDTDSALYYNTLSLEINTALMSKTDMSYDYNLRGSVYIELEDWKQAIENLEKAYALSEEYSLSDNKLDIAGQLGYAYYKSGNEQKSAACFMDYYALNDSIKRVNQNSFIQTELTRYTLFADSIKTQQIELERNLEMVKKENSNLANRINFRNYVYAIVILLLVVTLIAILFINARRRLVQTTAHEAVLKVQNDELKRTLISKEEKEILLKEIHHRVKNNLQIINSLIRLQANFMNAKNFREKLMETENRIRSMALIHEKLYKTGNLASLSVRNYIEELSFNILESYDNHKVKIKLKFDLEEREYGIDTLIPLGLIINEVLSNSLKHAFYERAEGNIFIAIRSEDNISFMTIRDDGIGADLTFDELKEDSLGMELIDSLCDQLDGKLHLDTEYGFEYNFEFRILK